MKVVINSCIGSFNVSPAAIAMLLKMNSPVIEKMTYKEYYDETKEDLMKEKGKICKVGRGKYFYFVEHLSGVIQDDKYVYCLHHDCWNGDKKMRTDPSLIKVVQVLKDKASAGYSELKIVEVPDNVDWEIEESHGWERVREKSRIWE